MMDSTVTLIQNLDPMNISTTTTTIASYGSSSFLSNCPLLSAIIAFALAQSIKFFTSWYIQFELILDLFGVCFYS